MRKIIFLISLCKKIYTLCDTSGSSINRQIYDIEGNHIQKLIDIAKPIIETKYQEYAQLFTDNQNIDPQILDMARTIAIYKQSYKNIYKKTNQYSKRMGQKRGFIQANTKKVKILLYLNKKTWQ